MTDSMPAPTLDTTTPIAAFFSGSHYASPMSDQKLLVLVEDALMQYIGEKSGWKDEARRVVRDFLKRAKGLKAQAEKGES